jgi:hypothetical protein
MHRLLLAVLMVFLASVGPISAPAEASGNGVVRMLFFWSDT